MCRVEGDVGCPGMPDGVEKLSGEEDELNCAMSCFTGDERDLSKFLGVVSAA